MNRSQRRFAAMSLAVVGLLLGLCAESGAGAWSQARGSYYAKLSGIFYRSDEVFNDMGDRTTMGMDDDSFAGDQSFFYLEYGLLERLTLVGQTSVGSLTAENRFLRRKTRGVGDVDLGVKYQLVDRPLVLSPQVEVKIPTGYHAEYDPALGTGKADLEFRLLAARSLYPWPFYLSAEVGYRVRGGLFSNQVPYFCEVGATPHERLFVKGYMEGAETLTDGPKTLGLVGLAQVSEGNFVKMGLNAAFEITGPLWADLLWERVVTGENVGAGGSWGVGLAYVH